MKRIGIAAVFLVIAAMTLVIVGCPNNSTTAVQSTSDNSSGIELTKVADVADNPMDYDGKSVTTEGNYAVGYCAACFLLKDGVSALRVEVTETAPLPPESKLNSRMRVTGKIYVVNGSPNLVASKIEYL